MIQIDNLNEFTSENILSPSNASKLIDDLKSSGKKVGLCHGGFDLLHPGHVKHFESARKICDILFVSITSDQFVTSRKGQGRPIYTDKLRAYMISQLKSVDYVTISDFKLGTDIIGLLKPSYYIKGPDFISKNTPGINSERDAIAKEGGEMRYTDDPTFSTTKMIDYIKNELDVKKILLVLDRDGTLIEDQDFLGKDEDWRSHTLLLDPVISLISFIQTKYKTTKIVISNQTGVARKLFTCARVEEINSYVGSLLNQKNIRIDNWQYSPQADSSYADSHPELDFDMDFVKEKSTRKPNTAMVDNALKELNMTKEDFSTIIMIGDRKEDEGLAKNLGALFIDATKDYDHNLKLVENL
ncbi:HAD-IIIA family hydrolase [Candidatus Woesearchaeota archaeon]|nr:HAD-IIIA family hydrolase [Candidatus Woesearchaeota archaeon]